MIGQFICGVKNLIAFAPVVWSDRDWDYFYLMRLMEFKLRKMSCYHSERGVTVDRDRTAKELKICAELCKRISGDNYFDIQEYKNGKRSAKELHETAERLVNQDIKLLGEMFIKHLRTWWD